MRAAILCLLVIIPAFSFAQFGVSFHQSNLPFVGINYEFKNRIRPEVRVGTDNFFEDMSLEGVVMYDFIQKDDYAIYAGIGGRTNSYGGLVIPVGINIYPLTAKQFGFHIELAPIIGELSVLRGSWGIRYRFGRGQVD